MTMSINSLKSKKIKNLFEIDPHLYGRIMGENKHSGFLLDKLGIYRKNVPRFRDIVFFEGDIILMTRSGGYNKIDYVYENTVLELVNGFIKSQEPDNGTDNYLYFFYRVPYSKDMEKMEHPYMPYEKFRTLHTNPESIKNLEDVKDFLERMLKSNETSMGIVDKF